MSDSRYVVSAYVDVIAANRGVGHGWSVIDDQQGEVICDCEKRENADLLADLLNMRQT